MSDAGDESGDAAAHLGLGEDDVVCADALEDAAVRLGERLGPDVRDADVDERAGGEHARLDVGADGDDGGHDVADAELAQGALVRRVGLGDVGQQAAHVLHADRVGIEPEHLVAHVDQRGGERGTEPAEADDDHLAVMFELSGAKPDSIE